MNTCGGKAKLKIFRILLDRGSTSPIVMGKLKSKLKEKSTETTMCETQEGKFTASKKVNVDFCLTEFSATKIFWLH